MSGNAVRRHAPAATEPEIVPLGRRIRSTFFAPARLTHQLGEAAPWLDVLLISTAVAVFSVIAVPDEVFLEPMQDAVTRRGEPVSITSSPDVIVRWGKAMGMLGTLATHPIIIFSLAGVLTLLLSVLRRGQASYRDSLSLTAHAMLIPALGTITVLLVRLIAGALGIPAPWAAAAGALPQDNIILAALPTLDPFVVWMLVVIAIGAHSLDRRQSRKVLALVLVGGYVVTTLATTALFMPHGEEPGAPQALGAPVSTR